MKYGCGTTHHAVRCGEILTLVQCFCGPGQTIDQLNVLTLYDGVTCTAPHTDLLCPWHLSEALITSWTRHLCTCTKASKLSSLDENQSHLSFSYVHMHVNIALDGLQHREFLQTSALCIRDYTPHALLWSPNLPNDTAALHSDSQGG